MKKCKGCGKKISFFKTYCDKCLKVEKKDRRKILGKKRPYWQVILFLIVFGVLFYYLVYNPSTAVCMHGDGFSCDNITIYGVWHSKDNYHIDVKNFDGSLLNDDHPIFENKAYCQIFLKERSLSFEEFRDEIKGITSLPNVENVTETISTESKPYTLQLLYNQCYGWGRTICPLDRNIKSHPCFFYQLKKETNPNSVLQVCEKTKLKGDDRRGCYYYAAMSFANINTDRALELCEKTVYFGAEKFGCYADVAKRLINIDIKKAIEICESKKAYCLRDMVETYQNIHNLTGMKLLKTCLYYEGEDHVTELLCKFNEDYFINWQGHRDLVYMYGEGYSEKAKILCDKMELLFPGNTRKKVCLETRDRYMKNLGRDLTQFVQQYPHGLGEET